METRNGTIDAPFYLVAQDKKYPNFFPFSLFGYNPDIDNGLGKVETVSPYGAVVATNLVADNLTLVSDEAADVIPIYVVGLDANYDPLYEVVMLNGTTPVQSTKEFLRINDLILLAACEGTITGTLNGEYARGVDAFYHRSGDTVFTVPNGYSLFIRNVILSAQNNDAATFYIAVAGPSGLKQRLTPLHVNEATFEAGIDGLFMHEKYQVSVEAIGDGSNNNVTAIIAGHLVRNTLGNFDHNGGEIH